MTMRRNDGTAVVELALLMPALLLMLGAAYVAARTATLKSAAASAAQAEAIRGGRRLSGIERDMAETILPQGSGVTIRTEKGKSAALLPSPFPSLDGRTIGVAEVDKGWEEAGDAASFPRVHLALRSEMSANCWDGETSSGRKIRNTVRVIVATAAVR